MAPHLLTFYSHKPRHLHNGQFLLLFAEAIQHKVEADVVACNMAALNEVEVALFGCFHRFFRRVHC